jgi:hypothetical protein
MDQSRAACKAAEISSKLVGQGGSCSPEIQNLSISEMSRLKTIKMTTPQSGSDATHILVEATLLQSTYGNNIEQATISLGADCRCYYTFRRFDENQVKIMGLQEHCAAHFSRWSY